MKLFNEKGPAVHPYTRRRSASVAAALVSVAVAGASLVACGGGGEAKVIIQQGKNAGKEYAPYLVGGGIGAEECIRQGLCAEED